MLSISICSSVDAQNHKRRDDRENLLYECVVYLNNMRPLE